MAKQTTYYEAHRRERLAYAAKYQTEHLEEHRQATERHRKKDPAANAQYQREYHREHAERVREQKRQSYHRRRAEQAEYNRERRDPEAVKARSLVATALRRGTIVKPKECSSCGTETPSRRLHAHHHRGYENPLDVQWLCSWCHGARHRKD